MQAEAKAWELLSARDPHDVCACAVASYDESSGSYAVDMFGHSVAVCPVSAAITGADEVTGLLLTKMAYFSRLSVLHYLAAAKAMPLSGRLIKPSELKVGPIYFDGSHVLPLKPMAAAFASDGGGFLEQGRRFGGVPREYGDASVTLSPFPRLPVTLILWCEDEEFPARSDILFDATCEEHVPADILWSIAMMSVLVMLRR